MKNTNRAQQQATYYILIGSDGQRACAHNFRDRETAEAALKNNHYGRYFAVKKHTGRGY